MIFKWNSLVGTVSEELDFIPVRGKGFFNSYNVQTSPGLHPHYYAKCTGALHSRIKQPKSQLHEVSRYRISGVVNPPHPPPPSRVFMAWY